MLALALLTALALPAGISSVVPDSVVFAPLDPRYGQDECAAGDAPAKPCRARVQWTEAGLRARWDTERIPVWLDGDTLTFVFEGDVPAVRTCCTVQLPMSRISRSSLWVLSARVARLDEAFFGYGFHVEGTSRLTGQGAWRGPHAPAPAPGAAALRGTVRTDSLDSAALGERRAITVYLPPGHGLARAGGTAVVYLADGQAVEGLARRIEPFVLSGELPPVVLVGLHSGDHRTEEYTSVPSETDAPGEGEDRYVAHERFLVDEVRPWAEQTFGAADRPNRRAVFGFSNGAVFAAAVALRHPDVFGAAVPFSCGACGAAVPDAPEPPDSGERPRFYFLSGVLEPGFHRSTLAAAERLQAAGYEAEFHERVSGHDPLMWDEAFAGAVRWAFEG